MKAGSKEPEASQIYVASRIAGVGMAVPDRVVFNDHFASYLDTSDQWIRERTGIIERRWADPETKLSQLTEVAGRGAIENAGMCPSDIDGVIVATITADYLFPSAACDLQRRLGITKGFAFDLNAVCSGFLYGLVSADALIASGQCNHVLVLGADIFSRLIDEQDRSTCILFGDGGAGVVLSKVSTDNDESCGQCGFRTSRYVRGDMRSTPGIYLSELHADGSGGDLLYASMGLERSSGLAQKNPSGTAVSPGVRVVKMNGREVFKIAVRSLVEVIDSVLKRAGLGVNDIDYFVSHQANKRILSAMTRQLSVPEEKVLSNVHRYGNTSAASVPLLLAEATLQGTLKPGQLILLSAFGGGLTWGAVLLRL